MTEREHNIEPGDMLHITNAPIDCPSGDYGRYLHRLGITYTTHALHENITLLYRPKVSLARLISHISKRLYQAMQSALPEKTSALLSTMFLGVRADDTSVQNQFLYGGVSHLLARSGLHVALCLLLWQLLLSLMPLPLAAEKLLLVLFALLYGLLTNVSISFMRALYFFVLYTAGIILGRSVQALHLLLFICLCMLLWNPYHLFFLDFELSFALTGAFAFAYSRKPYAKTN